MTTAKIVLILFAAAFAVAGGNTAGLGAPVQGAIDPAAAPAARGAHAKPSSYIVQAASFAVARAAVKRAGGHVTHELSIINAVAATLTAAQAAALRDDRRLTMTANGSFSVSSSIYTGTVVPYVAGKSQATSLHSQGITGAGVTIAFLDTGWSNKSAVQNNLAGHDVVLQGYDATTNTVGLTTSKAGISAPEDFYGHGTHVLSIATNRDPDANYNTIGVAPDAARVIVKAFDQNGQGTYANVIRGIGWILSNASTYNIRVVNMSFGAPPQSFYWQDPLAQAVMKLWQAGIVVVASAGNGGPAAQTITVPGNVPYVITVGSMTDNYTTTTLTDDYLDSFSSVGPTYEAFVKPEIVAPGGHVVGIMSDKSVIALAYPQFLASSATEDGAWYFEMSGTSMAAAAVTGTVALMLQAQPGLTPDQVKCKLMSSAQPAVTATGQLAYSVFQQGAGQINAYNAVHSTSSNCANVGLNINADIAGTAHFMGPARQAPNGTFYILDQSGNQINTPGYSWDASYARNVGYAWSTGYAWSEGFLWNNGYLWNNSYLWNSGYLWNQSSVPSTESSSGVNPWVPQE